MKHLRKWLAGMVCLCALLTGCSARTQQAESIETLNVYATFYPLYALTALVAEGVPDLYLNCLVQPQDGCLRDYSLSDWDYALLGSADAVIAGGRGLESFESLLYAMGDSGPSVSELLYNMELVTQPGANTQDDAESHWSDENPHIYMSVDGAIEIARRAAANLAVLDPKYEANYMENLSAGEEALTALKAELRETAGETAGEKVAVMNEALVYLAQDYELDAVLYYDRDSGEDLGDSELEDCLERLSESGARVVLIEKQAPKALCDALRNAGYGVAQMDVLSTRRASEGAQGYFDAMRENARSLSAALAAADAGGNE